MKTKAFAWITSVIYKSNVSKRRLIFPTHSRSVRKPTHSYLEYTQAKAVKVNMVQTIVMHRITFFL
jgi:hydroxymethylpyrimidine/phosphomethylpyrimidine kinase